MGRSFQLFTYVFTIIIGGLLLIFKDGRIDVLCIACNGFLANLFGIVAILTGIIGLAGIFTSKKTAINGR